MGTPFAFAFTIGGILSGTPGLTIIISGDKNISSGCAPRASLTEGLSLGIKSSSSLSVFISAIVTSAPSSESRFAAPIPLLARPTTVTFLPFMSISNLLCNPVILPVLVLIFCKLLCLPFFLCNQLCLFIFHCFLCK